MTQWRVRDVMTNHVITARDDASLAEIAAVLAARRISAVPIVDRFDVVIGVVSWTDLHDKIDIGELDGSASGGLLRGRRPARLRWADGVAADAMTAPAVTIGPDASLAAAGRVMHRRNVDRLLVTDDGGRLVGIVTRGDLLKVHTRLDAVIRDEVMQRILRRTLAIEPGAVSAAVDNGMVTLTGRTVHKTAALAAVGLTESVPGVTGVVDRIAFDVDDTVPVQAARPAAHDPLRGWWIGRGPHRPATRAATGAIAAHDHGRLPTHADQIVGSEALR